ncbi:MAG: DNA cytosine methyltransferase [Bradyrhizobium sp.]|nr:MAG: DNA cytosine methyltransferase [Bradyrhizobium sp.]
MDDLAQPPLGRRLSGETRIGPPDVAHQHGKRHQELGGGGHRLGLHRHGPHKRRKRRAPSRRGQDGFGPPLVRRQASEWTILSPVSDSPQNHRSGALPGFYEFFCGGGMARAGLGDAWRCLFANDFDQRKARAYVENWGAAELRVADVAALTSQDLPGRAELAWASFPCQDLSLAGSGAGLSGARSSAFWGFHRLMQRLVDERRAPRLIALENVLGLLTANGGADFVALCRAIAELGYRVGALTIDASHFVAQSRPRLFIVALREDISPPPALSAAAPSAHFAVAALQRAASALPADLAARWVWWRLPEPPRANRALIDCLDAAPADAPWLDAKRTQALLAQLSKASKAELAVARASGERRVAALFRRTRPGGVQAEARFDGLAGCLRTPGGGSSRQFLLDTQGEEIRIRLIGAREAARLMGLPESYRLPARRNEAYHLLGDGVVAPVMRFLSEHLLAPLAEAQTEREPTRRRA